jgi:hypothetical protein
MSIFKISRETKNVLIGIACICAISFMVAYFYYSSINKSEDPRIVETRLMFMRYDTYFDDKNYTISHPKTGLYSRNYFHLIKITKT